MNVKLYEVGTKTSVWTLYGPISDFNSYSELIKELYTAEPGDSVVILLNCPGGCVSIGQTIANAFNETKAGVQCIVEAPCYSMGAILALCGDGLVIKDHSFLMFHNYSTLMGGKENEIHLQHEAEKKQFTSLFNIYCKPFLSEKECTNILNGVDMYLHWDDPSLKNRIKKHFK